MTDEPEGNAQIGWFNDDQEPEMSGTSRARAREALRPCPSGHASVRVIGGPGTAGGPQFWVGCDICSWRTWGDTEAEAIAVWQDRDEAPVDRLPPEFVPDERSAALRYQAEANARLRDVQPPGWEAAAQDEAERDARLRDGPPPVRPPDPWVAPPPVRYCACASPDVQDVEGKLYCGACGRLIGLDTPMPLPTAPEPDTIAEGEGLTICGHARTVPADDGNACADCGAAL